MHRMPQEPDSKCDDSYSRTMNLNSRSSFNCRFMRKGKIGSYAEEMPKEFIKRFDEMIDGWDCRDIINPLNNTHDKRE